MPHPGRFLPPGKTRYPLYRRLGGPQGRSGQLRETSPPAGIRSTDRPAGSKSLYRLSYPGSPLRQCAFQITNPFLNLITVRSRESVTNPDHLNKINNTWHVTYSKPIQLIQRRIYILLHASTVAVQNLTLLFRIRYVPGSILGQSFSQ
jgi:hypothetical protein